MANITVKDLSITQNDGSSIRDLSEEELELQGGFFPVAMAIFAVVEIGNALYIYNM
jgi:hypothetical protein